MWKQRPTLSSRQFQRMNDENNQSRKPRKRNVAVDSVRLGLSMVLFYCGWNLDCHSTSIEDQMSSTTTRIFQAEWSEEISSFSSLDGQGAHRQFVHQSSPMVETGNLKHWYFTNKDDEIFNQDIELFVFNEEERRQSIEFLGEKCLPNIESEDFAGKFHSKNAVLEKYDEIGKWATIYKIHGLNERYASLLKIQLELWKFCLIGSNYASTFVQNSGLYFLGSIEETFDFRHSKNYLLLLEKNNHVNQTAYTTSTALDYHDFISTDVMSLRTEVGRDVAKSVVQSIISSPHTSLSSKDSGEWLNNVLYQHAVDAIQNYPSQFITLKSRCHGLQYNTRAMQQSKRYQSHTYFCARGSRSPCCEVNSELGDVQFFIQHPMIEMNGLQEGGHSYISTIDSTDTGKDSPQNARSKVDYPKTPRAFDIFLENGCLPSWQCHTCFVKSTNANESSCELCATECKCYCQMLCRVRPKERRVVKEIVVNPPQIRKDQSRLIPRIIHQTYFEPVTLENNYTHFSKLVESWKQSGWEYNFYDDEAAGKYLETHFPPEVLEAYNSILPGAYKADLFRLCVLLISGGIYSDVDVELTTDLDLLFHNNVGFVIPVDEPGRDSGNGSCMWNGFIAATPGHPFIAKALEKIVNQIRNRFTGVDIDDMLCPGVALDHSHSWDLLFLTGPCVIGGAINDVLNKHMQAPINPGYLDVSGAQVSLPGRSVILSQNKNDMGWHRFTWLEKNIIVAGTDMPDYEDRLDQKHYSDKPDAIAMSLFGTKNIYRDTVSKDEDIRITISSL